MFLVIDIGIFVLAIRVVIETEKPLVPAVVLAGSRLFYVRVSALAGAPQALGVFLGLVMFFGLCYLYFWLLVRIPMTSIWWWLAMLSLPVLRVLAMFPYGLVT
ncbi:MAG: hypothetical protein ACE5IK_13795 [Acidobacteriota bacterium]